MPRTWKLGAMPSKARLNALRGVSRCGPGLTRPKGRNANGGKMARQPKATEVICAFCGKPTFTSEGLLVAHTKPGPGNWSCEGKWRPNALQD